MAAISSALNLCRLFQIVESVSLTLKTNNIESYQAGAGEIHPPDVRTGWGARDMNCRGILTVGQHRVGGREWQIRGYPKEERRVKRSKSTELKAEDAT